MMLRTQLSLQRSMYEHYVTSSCQWRNVIIPDFSLIQWNGVRPNDDATKMVGPARSQHTQAKRGSECR